jgi:hypothetical protein
MLAAVAVDHTEVQRVPVQQEEALTMVQEQTRPQDLLDQTQDPVEEEAASSVATAVTAAAADLVW